MALTADSVRALLGTVADDVAELDKWWDGVTGTPSPVQPTQLPQGSRPPPPKSTPPVARAADGFDKTGLGGSPSWGLLAAVGLLLVLWLG